MSIEAAEITTHDGTAVDRFLINGAFEPSALASHLSRSAASPWRRLQLAAPWPARLDRPLRRQSGRFAGHSPCVSWQLVGRRKYGRATVERLRGLDTAFLYLETPTNHLHVAWAAVLDTRQAPGAASPRCVSATDPRPPSSRCQRCASGWPIRASATRSPTGSTLTSILPTTTRFTAAPIWKRSPQRCCLAPSTAVARCGRCTSSRVSARAAPG